MPKRIAINGFGRIGRLTFRNLLNKPDVEVVAINDLTDNETLAHLLKYDTMHGRFAGRVKSNDKYLTVNSKKILAMSEKDPAKLPWKSLNIDVVLECTGFFLSREKAQLHLDAGAKKVVLSAPPKSKDIPMIVIGANDGDIKASDKIISNASCTTNCLTPMLKIMDKEFGIDRFYMTTTHAYTSDQNIQDAPHRKGDKRRARAAALNIVPTSTGAAKAVLGIMPHLKGRTGAGALRVPTATGSLTEVTFLLKKDATVEKINAAFKNAATKKLKGILEYQEDPIVSSDIVGNNHSCIFDSLLTSVNGPMARIIGWYDNEAGYSARLADLADMVSLKK